MKKILLVLAVLALGTLASAQTFGFGVSFGSTYLYCNYEQLVPYSGGLWAGSDNLSPCGSSVNATISGFSANIPLLKNPVAHGAGVIYGDTIYATFSGLSNAQWTVFTKLKCNNIRNHHFVGLNGWEGVAGYSGFLLGTNQGPLSCLIPGKNGKTPTKGANVAQR